MVRIVQQLALWHPEHGVVQMPAWSSDQPLTHETIWERFPESVSMEPWQVKATYESQGWRVVQALVSVQMEGE